MLDAAKIIGEAPAIKAALLQAQIVASSDANVLLLGETGTGKELVARAIHRWSRRSGRRLVPVNCAAIPSGLLESELFGHEEGAFTGALTRKIGRLELAHEGTLLLDEVGDIPLEIQPKLLRVLQEGEFERLGSTETRRIDVRIIAATNRDLPEAVKKRQFREDLFYRLSVFPIRLPALRERRDDIPQLTKHFVESANQRFGTVVSEISDATMEALKSAQWDGNIRELQNVIDRAVLFTENQELNVPLHELMPSLQPRDDRLNTIIRCHLIKILREAKGKVGGEFGAARRLGLRRTTLQSKMKQLGIRPEEYR